MVDNTPDEVLAGLQLDAHVTGLAYAPEGHCLYTVATSSPLGGEGGSSRHRRFREFVVLHAQIKQSLQLGPFPLTRFRPSSTSLHQHRTTVLDGYLQKVLASCQARGDYPKVLLDFIGLTATASGHAPRKSLTHHELASLAADLTRARAPRRSTRPESPLGTSSGKGPPPLAGVYPAVVLLLAVLRWLRALLSLLDAPLARLEDSLARLQRRRPPPTLEVAATEAEKPPAVAPAVAPVVADDGWRQRIAADECHLTDGAAKLYTHLAEALAPRGVVGLPFYLLPPRGVEAWEVSASADGRAERFVVHLKAKHRLMLEAVPEPPMVCGVGSNGRFDIRFERCVTFEREGGKLVRLKGVKCKALPLTFFANVITIQLPTATSGMIFTAKLPLIQQSLALPLSYFTVDYWAQHGSLID